MAYVFRGSQPYFPVIEMKIGDFEVTATPPSHLMEFTYDRLTDAGDCGSKLTFSLYDDTAIEVEAVLLQGYMNVSFRYGWVGGTMTSWKKAQVQEYQLNFEASAIILDVSCVVTAEDDNVSDTKSETYKPEDYHGKPHEIVAKICSENNWNLVYNEPTVSVMDDNGQEKTFVRQNQSPKNFIITELCDVAVSAESGATGYKFYFDDDGNANFEPISNVETPEEEENTEVDTSTVDGVYEFYSGKYNNSVISFSPEFKGKLALVYAGGLQASSVNDISNEMLEVSVSSKKDGLKISTDDFNTIMGVSSTSMSDIEKYAKSMWNVYSPLMGYRATLELMGDPTVKVMGQIKVYVYTKQGYLHHTSGIYRVISASDSISGGSYTTTLALQKTANPDGHVGSNISMEINQTIGNDPNNPYGGGDYTGGDGGNSVALNSLVEQAVQWAIATANNNSIGYTWGGGSDSVGYDCSGFVNNAFAHAGLGLTVGQHGPSTSSMISTYQGLGFKWYAGAVDVNKLQRGDIVLSSKHTELYIGNNQLVGAHQNYDGVKGDSSGKEISVTSYSNQSWNGFLRYEGSKGSWTSNTEGSSSGTVVTPSGNSSLVNCTVLSPEHSGKRTMNVDRITPHCVVGQLSAENIGHCFPSGRGASCNYGIGTDGRVCLIVDEKNRSWCTSSSANDQRAITIECASDMTHPYTMNNAVYNKLIALCVDICRRYGKKKLLWYSDKTTALNYNPKSDEMLLTVHRWYANKECPGDWLFNRLGDVARRVTSQL